VAYNGYGVVVVWSYTGTNKDCEMMDNISLAVITIFFILPLACFSLEKIGSIFRPNPEIDA